MKHQNENGYILTVALLLLLVLSILGVTAIGTSSIDNMIAGNIRLRILHEARADGSTELGPPIVESAMRHMNTVAFDGIVTDPGLSFELRSTSFDPDNTDISYCGGNVTVDIDKMYSFLDRGGDIKYGEGYGGSGKSAASNMATVVRINATSRDVANSEGTVGAVYIYKK